MSGKHVENASEGFRIEFIGPRGTVLETINREKSRFTINQSIPYTRAKVTFTRRHPQTDTLEEYFAWGQPVFTDARAGMVAPKGNGHKTDAGGGK
jgi:hypothetical protein